MAAPARKGGKRRKGGIEPAGDATRVFPPGESPKEQRAASERRRKRQMTATLVVIALGVLAAIGLAFLSTRAPLSTTVGPEGRDPSSAKAEAPTPIPDQAHARAAVVAAALSHGWHVPTHHEPKHVDDDWG